MGILSLIVSDTLPHVLYILPPHISLSVVTELNCQSVKLSKYIHVSLF